MGIQREREMGRFKKLKARGEHHYTTSAYFLTFLFFRALELAALITIVGITSSWVGALGSHELAIPKEITTLLGFSAAGLLACGASIFAAFLGQHLLLAAMSLLDLMFIIVFSIFIAKLGPVSFVNCGAVANDSAAAQATTANNFVNALGSTQSQTSQAGSSFTALIETWVISSSQHCMQLRGAWGTCIGLAILFFITLLLGLGLVYKKRKNLKEDEDEDDYDGRRDNRRDNRRQNNNRRGSDEGGFYGGGYR